MPGWMEVEGGLKRVCRVERPEVERKVVSWVEVWVSWWRRKRVRIWSVGADVVVAGRGVRRVERIACMGV